MAEDRASAEPQNTATSEPNRTGGRPSSRWLKWLFVALAGAVLAVGLGAVFLNTPIGERFLANRIAEQTLPNGLNIRIGRIEGNLYGKAVLHDVILSDPKGEFMRISRAEADWRPLAWLNYKLEVARIAAKRARLERLPEFLESDEDGPLFPGFDIEIGAFEIDQLTLAEAVTGGAEQIVNLAGSALIEDQKLMLATRGAIGTDDRFALDLDAAPEADLFDLALDYNAGAGGFLASYLGDMGQGDAAYRARIAGEGSWQSWDGALLVTGADTRLAALKLSARDGEFGALGEVYPAGLASGLLADALGEVAAIDAKARIAERRIDGRYALRSAAISAQAQGVLDLADNRLEGFAIEARLLKSDLFGTSLTLENAALTAQADGKLNALSIPHSLSIGRLASGAIVAENIRQSGLANYDGERWRLPIKIALARLVTGNSQIDPHLGGGRAEGDIILAGDQLSADQLSIAFADIGGTFALRGDLTRGTYGAAGTMALRNIAIEGIGSADGTARLNASLGEGWDVSADINATLSGVSNSAIVNLAGPAIRLNGGAALSSAGPLRFKDMRLASRELTAQLDGEWAGADGRVTGGGRHSQYGPFTIAADVSGGSPRASLVFADPYPAAGLTNVRVALASQPLSGSAQGFRITANGGSLLGPFDGLFNLAIPASGGLEIGVEQLAVSRTDVRGAIALADGGVVGELFLTGGGLDGVIGLDPRGQNGVLGQGVDVSLTARGARFDGAIPITLARADIAGSGVISADATYFSGEADGRGLSYGNLFIGRFAAQGELKDGRGQIDASLTGSRGGSFRLDLNSAITPQRVTLAARGEYGGRRITMPRRAVLSRLSDNGWRLEPTQFGFGRGAMIASGSYADDGLSARLQLDRMPLSLADLASSQLGLNGRISGEISLNAPASGRPTGSAKILVKSLRRSGLAVTSQPIDLALVASLRADQLEARAKFSGDDIRRGRFTARISGLGSSSDLTERLRLGQLRAGVEFDGPAQSLWRLAGVSAFDITGPAAVRANVTGTVADPRVQGAISSDDLRIQSTLSGTDVRGVTVRGNFDGSRLRLTRFSGTAINGGTVSGSGIVDMADLGERVIGNAVEVRGPRLDLKIAAKNARLLEANGLSATISGPLRIVSDGLAGTIAGRVTINRASWVLGTAADDLSIPDIATREVNVPDDRAPRTAAQRPWRYLINAKGRSRIDVDGMGLDSEWGADIRLRGTTSDPRIGGEANMVRGLYSFAGTRFELTRGRIAFDENVAIDPQLDIVAETDADGLDVAVEVSGNALRPQIAFTSNPALPEEELLAQLLFGGSVTNLSATDALQLGSALASLRGGGGLDPINQLRSAIGLDRLRIVSADPALDRGTGLAVGKNIGRRFYIELITDGRGYSATEAEFRITNWLSILGAVSTIGRDSVVAEVSRDY